MSQLTLDAPVGAAMLGLRRAGCLLFTDKVRVNGRAPTGCFVIDTGATFTVLDRRCAAELDLTGGARSKSLECVLINVLSVGPLVLANHAVGVSDFENVKGPDGRAIAGSIGGDVLGALPFTLDLEARTITFWWRDRFLPPAGVTPQSLSLAHPKKLPRGYLAANPSAGMPLLHGAINGHPARLSFDSGADRLVVLMPPFIAAHPGVADPSHVAGRVAGVSGGRGLAGINLLAAHVSRLDVAGGTFNDIPDALAILRSSLPGDEDAIIGAHLLRYARLTFDYAAGHVWVDWRSQELPAR